MKVARLRKKLLKHNFSLSLKNANNLIKSFNSILEKLGYKFKAIRKQVNGERKYYYKLIDLTDLANDKTGIKEIADAMTASIAVFFTYDQNSSPGF